MLTRRRKTLVVTAVLALALVAVVRAVIAIADLGGHDSGSHSRPLPSGAAKEAKSKATQPAVVELSARQLRAPAGADTYGDSTAPSGEAIALNRGGRISTGPLRFAAQRVAVWARTRDCHGPARLQISVDGKRQFDAAIQDGPWREYSAVVNVPQGTHVVDASFPNPKTTSSCARGLRLSSIVISKAVAGSSERGGRLVFDDEFNGNSLDTGKWNPRNWKARSPFYDPANVIVGDGMLRLRASAANRSAMAQTLHKYAFAYGRLEASIRLPRGAGFWPAFWLETTNLTKTNPEIDLLEMQETDRRHDLYDRKTISQNYHWESRSTGRPRDQHSWIRFPDSLTSGFHRYTVDWEPGRLRWYVDGVQTKEVKSNEVARTKMFIILSLQIGHAPFIPGFGPDKSTPFPSYMDVEYVRVYRR